MRHFGLALFATIAAATLAAGMACGGDEQPQSNSRAAGSIDGVWSGTYMAYDGGQSGSFCASFEQDGSGITGEVSFNGGEPSKVSGVTTQDTFLFTWGTGLLESRDASALLNTAIAVGGTINGTSSQDTLSGTWISAASAEVHGNWTATRRLGSFPFCK